MKSTAHVPLFVMCVIARLKPLFWNRWRTKVYHLLEPLQLIIKRPSSVRTLDVKEFPKTNFKSSHFPMFWDVEKEKRLNLPVFFRMILALVFRRILIMNSFSSSVCQWFIYWFDQLKFWRHVNNKRHADDTFYFVYGIEVHNSSVLVSYFFLNLSLISASYSG